MPAKPDKVCSVCGKNRYETDVTHIGDGKLICGVCARKFVKRLYPMLKQSGFVLQEKESK